MSEPAQDPTTSLKTRHETAMADAWKELTVRYPEFANESYQLMFDIGFCRGVQYACKIQS